MRAQVQDRLFATIGAALVLALLGYILVLGLSVNLTRLGQRSLALLDLRPPPPPAPHREPRVERVTHRAVHAPSPRNLKAVATPVVAPPPLVPPPPAPPPLIAASRAGIGAEASAGASDRPGPGEGAGGEGEGTGGGGDGGDGGEPPHRVGGRLNYGALPPALREARVEGDGRGALLCPAERSRQWLRRHPIERQRRSGCGDVRAHRTALPVQTVTRRGWPAGPLDPLRKSDMGRDRAKRGGRASPLKLI